jgi:hypothetical protein
VFEVVITDDIISVKCMYPWRNRENEGIAHGEIKRSRHRRRSSVYI